MKIILSVIFATLFMNAIFANTTLDTGMVDYDKLKNLTKDLPIEEIKQLANAEEEIVGFIDVEAEASEEILEFYENFVELYPLDTRLTDYTELQLVLFFIQNNKNDLYLNLRFYEGQTIGEFLGDGEKELYIQEIAEIALAITNYLEWSQQLRQKLEKNDFMQPKSAALYKF